MAHSMRWPSLVAAYMSDTLIVSIVLVMILDSSPRIDRVSMLDVVSSVCGYG